MTWRVPPVEGCYRALRISSQCSAEDPRRCGMIRATTTTALRGDDGNVSGQKDIGKEGVVC